MSHPVLVDLDKIIGVMHIKASGIHKAGLRRQAKRRWMLSLRKRSIDRAFKRRQFWC